MAVSTTKYQLTVQTVEVETAHAVEAATHAAAVALSGSSGSLPAPRQPWSWKGTIAAGGQKTIDLNALEASGWVGDIVFNASGYYWHYLVITVPSEANPSNGEVTVQKSGVGSNRVAWIGTGLKVRVGSHFATHRNGWDSEVISGTSRNLYINNDGASPVKVEVTFLVGERNPDATG